MPRGVATSPETLNVSLSPTLHSNVAYVLAAIFFTPNANYLESFTLVDFETTRRVASCSLASSFAI
jgi:hypothetical protein